jgi:cell division protease FtsH
MEKKHKFSLWYVILGIWVVLIVQNYIASMYAAQIIPYSQFLNLLKTGKVTEIAISANQIQGKMKIDGAPNELQPFKSIRVDPDLSKMLEQYPAVSFKGEIESTFLRDLFSWIFPLILFVGVWYFLMKRMGGQQAGFMTLGKNRSWSR